MHSLPQPSSYLENTQDKFLENKTKKTKQFSYVPITDPILSLSLKWMFSNNLQPVNVSTEGRNENLPIHALAFSEAQIALLWKCFGRNDSLVALEELVCINDQYEQINENTAI